MLTATSVDLTDEQVAVALLLVQRSDMDAGEYLSVTYGMFDNTAQAVTTVMLAYQMIANTLGVVADRIGHKNRRFCAEQLVRLCNLADKVGTFDI